MLSIEDFFLTPAQVDDGIAQTPTDPTKYLYVRDLSGNEYALQATLTHELELNGNQSASCTIYPTKVNALFIEKISEMWTLIDYDGIEHKVIYVKKQGEGSRLSVEVTAIPLFFDTLDTMRIYEEYNEHMTAQLAFTRIFSGTGFNFVLVDSFDAVQWEGFGGGESRLETFKRALERYRAEFRIMGNTVYLEKQIGRDTQFQYRYRLNASNIVKEIDGNSLWTYAKGYGDYEDGDDGGWETAKLVREYMSPLANIIGIRHAPPIKDGRVTDQSTMDAALKELVDESLKISVSADIHDLRRQGYSLAQPELGDRVFIIDERIGLDDEVRVVHMNISRNWRGEVIDLQITFGSDGLTKRHQSNLQTAVREITEIMAGRRTLPMSAYDVAVINATEALKRITSELTTPPNGGLLAIDKDNPNNVVLFNAAGIGVSVDGGASFKNSITGAGVVAETIVGDHIIGVNLSSIDESGYFHVNGSNAEFVDTNTNRRVTISPNGLYGYNANNSVRFQADSDLVTSAALGTSNLNVYLAAGDTDLHGEVRTVRRDTIPGTGDPSDYSYINLRTRAIKSPPGANAYIGTDGELRIMSEGLASVGVYRNVRMHKAFANEVEVNGGSVLYLRSSNRVRIMNEGSSNTYSDLQLADIMARSIRRNTDMAGTHFYLGADQGELRVTTNALSDGGYRPVRASDFLPPSSSRETKKNISKYETNVLDSFRNTSVYTFHYNQDNDNDKKRLGVMLDEVPEIIWAQSNDTVEMYSTIGYLWKGIKDIVSELDDIKSRLGDAN